VLVKTKITKKYIKVFTASITDINKALRKKSKTDPRKVLDPFYHLWLLLFDNKEANKLPSLRGIGINHAIELEKVDSKELIVL
jgi:hypothetical protein